MSKTISVIIPVYNVEKYLNQCIGNVLSQFYKNIEVLLIDDGSTDKSFEICEKYLKSDSRIYLVHKKNGGVSLARNIGIQCSKGDYIVFLDGDDFWRNNDSIANIVKNLKNNVDMVCFGYREYKDNNSENGIGISFIGFDDSYSDKNELFKEMISKGVYVSSPWCKVIKKDVIIKNDLYFCEGITSEDIDWSARLLIAVKSINVYCDSFYCYRQRSDSVVHNLKYENLEVLANNILKCIKLAEGLESKDFSDLYYNYVSYQYITFLKVALLCENDSRTKTLVKEMKSYKWLLDFHLNKKVKIVYWFNKLFGFNLMLKCLKLYSKG